MKTAFVIGSQGQDGRIAVDLLANKGYKVLGFGRETIDITNQDAVLELMKTTPVDEIYYLAACHQSSQDQARDNAALFQESHAVNVEGLLYFLKGMQGYAPQARLFYASSSLIFEGASMEKQNENTPFSPESIYAMSKLDGLLLCRYYRKHYGTFASVGIMYNHESRFRRETFISRKRTGHD